MKTKQLFSLLFVASACTSVQAQFGTYLDGGAQNGYVFSSVRSIGIGDFSATNANTTAQSRLHVRNEFLAQPTASGFDGFLFRTDGNTSVDNKWQMFTGTSGAFNEIFKFEVPSASPNSLLLQSSQSSGDILFNTGGANLRAIISSAGLVGINTATPGNQLELNSGITNASGLRFSQLTSASPAGAPTNSVLSVDSNGDVILVTASGSGGGATAKNGLNTTVGAPDVELGGTLLHATDIDFNSNNLAFEGSGQFGIGENVTASTLPIGNKIFVDNTAFSTSMKVVNNAPAPDRLTAGTFSVNVNNPSYENIGVHGWAEGNEHENRGGFFHAEGTNSSASTVNKAVMGSADNCLGVNYGGAFAASSTAPNFAKDNIGVFSEANYGIENFGFYTRIYADPGATTSNYGVYSEVNSGTSNVGISVGVLAKVGGVTNATKFGHLANMSALNDDGNVGVAGYIGATGATPIISSASNIAVYGGLSGGYNPAFGPANPNNFAGYFDGNVRIVGSAVADPTLTTPPGGLYALDVRGNAITTAGAWYVTSDKRYKQDIKRLENVSDNLKKLNAYTYKYNADMFQGKANYNPNNQIGLIAQELKEVYPEFVNENHEGYLAVNYSGLVPVLIEGFKEQENKIAVQQRQIDELKALVQSLIAGNTGAGNVVGSTGAAIETKVNTKDVTLSNKNILILDQNVPNPFADNTTIHYNIPSDFGRAQLSFVNNDGKIIKVVEITEKGEGLLNVFAGDLSNGLYSYTLIIDGKAVETKKMVKQ